LPHIIVKLWPGKSDEQKRKLSDHIVQGLTSILSYGPDSVSVGFEEVCSHEWTRQVYEPDILGNWDNLTKVPGYGPGASQQLDGGRDAL